MRGLYAVTVLFLVISAGVVAATDSYYEDFNSRNPDVTINGQDFWSVTQGGDSNAIVDDTTTPTGTGRSLKVADTTPAVIVSRPRDYGGVSPTWVSYAVKAASGAKQRVVPSTGIAAVTFDYSGKILASNGASWVDTGMTYTEEQWYEVTLKLDFTTHRYDLYVSLYGVPDIQFVPVKSNLQFIDTSISKLSKFGFGGPYSAAGTKSSFIDDISISYIYRLEFITTPQTVVQDGVSGPMTVQLQDFYAEPQTAVGDYALDLKSTSSRGKFSLAIEPWVDVTQIILPRSSQQVTFYYKDPATGSPVVTVSEYPERGWLDTLQQERIIPKTAYFEVSTTTPQVAGQNFKLNITAKEGDGNIDINYSGTIDLSAVYISPSTGTKYLSLATASGFSGGKLELDIAYADAGTISISVSDHDDLGKTGSSGSIVFLPASFGVSAETPQIVSQSFNLEVEAKNLQGQLTPNYKSDARLSPVLVNPVSAGGAAFLPATISGEAFSGGKADISVSYNRWGTIKIKAEDALYPYVSAESSGIEFFPKAVKVSTPTPPSGRDFFYIGEVFTLDISVVDAAESPIANFTGQVAITASPNLSLPSEYLFEGSDQGKRSFPVFSKATGTFTVSAREPVSNLFAESGQFIVKNVTIIVTDTVSPVGTTEIEIQLVDDQGRVITTENNLEISVKLIEELDNVSASSMATVTPVRFINGKISITVSDTEAEEVGVLPQTALGLKIKAGKVTFGRAAKSGIGTLMWREMKDKEEKKK